MSTLTPLTALYTLVVVLTVTWLLVQPGILSNTSQSYRIDLTKITVLLKLWPGGLRQVFSNIPGIQAHILAPHSDLKFDMNFDLQLSHTPSIMLSSYNFFYFKFLNRDEVFQLVQISYAIFNT